MKKGEGATVCRVVGGSGGMVLVTMVGTILPGVRYPLRGRDVPPGWMYGLPGRCTVTLGGGGRFTTWMDVGLDINCREGGGVANITV